MKEKYLEDIANHEDELKKFIENEEAKHQAEQLNCSQAESRQQRLFPKEPTDPQTQPTLFAKPECK
jgi:hypothetical protein